LARRASSGGNTLTWTKRDGTVLGTLGTPGIFFEPRISPDGAHVVFDRPDGDRGNRDLWTMDAQTGTARRLTTNPANDLEPVWSGDGKQILFASDRAGRPAMEFYEKSAATADGEQKIAFKLPSGQFDVSDWSRDGRWVALQGRVPPDNGILIAPIAGDRAPFPFFRSRFADPSPRFSPDGKWIAYSSDEPGRRDILVRAFAGGPADSAPAIEVSDRGGSYPVWSRDGSELFYMASDFKMYSVRTRDLKPGSVPISTALFTACPGSQPFYQSMGAYPYDVAPDGRFLILCRSGQSSFELTVNAASASRP
jgi:Tol biopolymer transport system component